MKRLAGLAALGALSLGAQDPEDLLARALGDTQLKAAARRAQGAEEAPADVTVLSGQELRALGYRTLGAALAGVLGFRDNDDRAYANVGIRGVYLLGDQNTRILVLLDGHPLNSPAEVGSSKVGEDFGVPLERVDHVEIIRGPASSLYGANAFLATVNVVTAEATATGGWDQRGAVTAGGGGLLDAWASLRIPGPGFSVNLNVGGLRRRGTSLNLPELSPAPLAADLDRERRSHAYLFIQGARWSFSGYVMDREQRLPQAPFASVVGSPENAYRNRLAFGEFRAEPRFGGTTLLTRVFWDWNRFGDTLVYDGVRDPALTGVWEDLDLDQSLGAELQARRGFGEAWTATGGVEQAWHRFKYTLSGPGTEVPREIWYRIRKVYGEAEWAPSASLGVTFGLQRSELLLDEARSLADPSRTFTLGTYGRWSPRLAGVWRPTETDTLKGLYSEGIRNPTLFERFSEDDGLAFVDNPGLALESLRSGGVLWLRDWGRGWRSHLGVHTLRWSNAIRAVDLSPTLQQFQNDPAELRGQVVEAQLHRRRGAWDWTFQLARNRWTRQGGAVDNAADLQAGLRLIWSGEGATLAGEWRGVGARELAGAGRIPFQHQLRASARWEGDLWVVQVTGEDLLDRRPHQWVAVDYDPVRRIPGEGRRLVVSFGWKL